MSGALLLAGAGFSLALAATDAAAVPTVACPTVADKLPAVPAQAQAEVTRNLALLNTQIAEANNRLATTVGQGGPNFIQNAILGPLADKRLATVNRIATAIGRNAARPAGLESLATCTLSSGGAVVAPGGNAGNGNAGGNAGGAAPGAGAAAGPGTIVCPTVADKLPAIPAQAQAEVTRNLALLNTQIAEANNRLATTVGQGGANFVQNAILGPLADKRLATVNRIATAIGRNAARPAGLESLATCALSSAGAAAPGNAGGDGAAGGSGAAGGNGNADGAAPGAEAAAGPGTIVCPTVADKLPAIPAQAQIEVTRNLALLNTQIAEANNRLATTVGQGGPNFVQNAILGPLADKRLATVNRIATAIGRNAARPAGLESLATCSVAAAA